jgi:DNA-binding NtrC family response regulator
MNANAPQHAGDAELPVSDESAVTALSIAILDDDDDFREFLRSSLEAEGHDVRACATPQMLFDACETRMPDVVLLDIKMGRHSGEEVLAEIRKRWSKLCVIVVTGYPTMDSMRQTFKQDVFDYIAKPFSMAELRRSLTQATTVFGLGSPAPNEAGRSKN